jgi:hypothetical protein
MTAVEAAVVARKRRRVILLLSMMQSSRGFPRGRRRSLAAVNRR